MKLASMLAMAVAMTLATPAAAAEDTGIPGPAQDPNIWLEEARSDKALDWVRAENERTLGMLGKDPRFAELKAEALAIFDSEDKIPFVSIRPDGLYNFWQDKTNPKGLLRRTTLESYRTDKPVWETVLDVDALAKADGREWVYKGTSCLPPEQRLCMIALSDGGKDATVLREFDMATKSFVPGGFVIDSESQGGVEWLDKDTLLVGRDFGEGTLTESQYPFTTRLWKRGTDLAKAPEIFRGAASDVWSGANLLRDAAGTVHGYLGLKGLDFYSREWSYAPTASGPWTKLDLPPKSQVMGIVDGQLLFSTDEDWQVDGKTYPADALVSVDLAEFKEDPNGAAKTLVWAPGDRQTKQGTTTTSDSLYVDLLDNVRGKVIKFDFVDGKWVEAPVDLPDNATIGIAAASDERDEVMFTVTDFLNPTRLYHLDGASGAMEVIKTSPAFFDPDGMAVEQLEATSKDGTKIPYFVVKPKGMELDGSNPTLLNGYGGFQIPSLPGYSALTGKLWLERGGVFILGNMRGGGEFGPMWHQSAIRENKQRTWDDFIAIAEDAIARKITSPEHLGIMGGSQGGLLVGTAMTQRPDLFNGVIVQIPLFDMLRYHLIGRGASWIGEYGDPRIPEQRAWIEPYSPYQHIVAGVDYPSPFLWASTADDRTHPAHARKAAAKLKALGQPYYYYEEMTGGHSGGVDNEQRAQLQALQYVYLLERLKD